MMTDADFFAANPNRALRLREVQASDPTPIFGDFRPVVIARSDSRHERMKLAALVHRKGTIRLYYIPQKVPLAVDWLPEELAELLTNPRGFVEINRKRGFDPAWLGALPCPTLD